MIIVLLNVYLVLLFILVKLTIVPFNLFWKISPAIVLLGLLVGLFIPMGWGAPSGPVLVIRHSVQIVPNVAGEVIEVPVEPNKRIKANDVLFRIDPVPFQAQVGAIEAQLRFQELRLAQVTQLQDRGTGRAWDVEERQAEVDPRLPTPTSPAQCTHQLHWHSTAAAICSWLMLIMARSRRSRQV